MPLTLATQATSPADAVPAYSCPLPETLPSKDYVLLPPPTQAHDARLPAPAPRTDKARLLQMICFFVVKPGQADLHPTDAQPLLPDTQQARLANQAPSQPAPNSLRAIPAEHLALAGIYPAQLPAGLRSVPQHLSAITLLQKHKAAHR